MVDDQTLISFAHPFRRSTWGPTRLRHLSLKRASVDKTPVTIDVSTRVVSGPNVVTFTNYLGVVAREKISILTLSWDLVTKVNRNMLWKDLLVMYTLLLLSYIVFNINWSILISWYFFFLHTHFDIPNVECLRSKVWDRKSEIEGCIFGRH